jgi:hypothetical protein
MERTVPDRREEALERMRRNSGLSLEGGEFRYQGAPLQNDRVAELFYRGLAVRDDGAVTLTVGRWWCYVASEGPAFVVERFGRGDDGARVARLRGGVALGLGGGALAYVQPQDRFVLWLRGLGGPALLERAAHEVALTALMRDGEAWLEAGGEGAIWLDALGVPCVLMDAAPGPATQAPPARVLAPA